VALKGPTFPTVNPVGIEGAMGFCEPQVKTCGYPRLAPSGPDRKLLSLAPMPPHPRLAIPLSPKGGREEEYLVLVLHARDSWPQE